MWVNYVMELHSSAQRTNASTGTAKMQPVSLELICLTQVTIILSGFSYTASACTSRMCLLMKPDTFTFLKKAVFKQCLFKPIIMSRGHFHEKIVL